MLKKYKILFIFTSIFLIIAWLFYQYTQTNFHIVLENKVFRSAQLSADALTRKINEYQIATVVNLRGPNPSKDWYIKEKQVTSSLKVKHLDIKLASSKLNRVNRIKRIIDIYQEEQKPILFHCNGGADRSSLASIIVLLLDGKLSLDEIKKQFSWYYLVIKSDSTGKLFLKNYRLWLDNNKIKHSPSVFIYWVDNYYQDSNGNRLYRINKINNSKLPEIGEVLPTVTLSTENNSLIEISGTIMFYKGRKKPTDVEVLLKHKPVSKMLSSKIRPSTKRVFDYYGFTQTDWFAIQNTKALKDGCYAVQLKLTRNKEQSWISPTLAELCITQQS